MDAYDQAARWRASVPRLTFIPMIEAGAALLALLLFSQALIGPLFADPLDPETSEGLRLLWPPVYLATLVLIAARPLMTLSLVVKAWPLAVLVALTMISAAWSIDPEVTARRALGLIFTTLFAFWFAARFSWRDMIVLIASMYVILAFGSFIAGLLFPSFAIHDSIHPGAWKGLWWEKNTLGAMMAWATLAFVAAAALDTRRRVFWLAMVMPAVALVLLSTSRTSLLACMLAIAGPLMIAMARRSFGHAAFALTGGGVAVALAALVLIVGPGVFLEALGRDATLTGRTDIWEALLVQIGERPWLGYGYGAYWSDERGPVFWLRQATNWPVPTAHNAWLETAAAIGIPGAIVALIVLMQATGRAAMRLFHGRETYWALTYFAIFTIISVSESNLLGQNSLGWVLFCATAAKLAGGERALPPGQAGAEAP